MSRPRRELPLPGDAAPQTRRPLPGTPGDDASRGPAPPLPSRGGGPASALPRKNLPTPEPPSKLPSRNPLDRRDAPAAHPVPVPRHASRLPPTPPNKRQPSPIQKQESLTSDDGDIYNEADVGEVYQDCDPEQEEYTEFDVGAEVEEEESQETYDEFEIQAVEEQETYEISDDVHMEPDEVYQEMDGPEPPPPPPSRPIPPPPKNPSPTPPPPPPPPQSKRVPLEKKAGPPKPQVQKQKPGGLDLSEVLKKRSNLRKVESTEERPISTNDVKEYATGEDMRSKLEMFRQKEEADDDSSSNTDQMSVPSNIRDRVKMLQGNSPPFSHPRKAPPSLPQKALPFNHQSHPPPPPRPGPTPPKTDRLAIHNRFGHSPERHNKSHIKSDSQELPPPPKMEDIQPAPPPKTKDSYTKVDPTTKSSGNTGQNAPLVPNGNQNDWPDDYDDDDDGDIYDDVAAALADPLGAFSWYHGELEREEGNKKLKKIGKDGCFLMRKCSNKKKAETQPYTLMVYYSGYNYNLKVRFRSDKRYALGEEKADEVTFETVPELISHHQSNEVILVHKSGKQYSTLLTGSPS
ncbi:pollen-specific leucine-rich repeat extensin-like protein 1 isoform X3 [Mizuhopecten yessoensis]|uniref:pollen-specific leucine-rich repeat extensin-like protein 1 isoform X3 n=1 Tax=Mizuhopecten yessoensis TaxID=6573 RepID=UPI000B457B59|nr:pollen-specific leucine-rich repeat extensin-like protein 1 isoform X3 [Mizuhopecten yessoensis]